jgi:hypothetical protein
MCVYVRVCARGLLTHHAYRDKFPKALSYPCICVCVCYSANWIVVTSGFASWSCSCVARTGAAQTVLHTPQHTCTHAHFSLRLMIPENVLTPSSVCICVCMCVCVCVCVCACMYMSAAASIALCAAAGCATAILQTRQMICQTWVQIRTCLSCMSARLRFM